VGNKAEVARFFGVALNTIEKWVARGMPGRPTAWDLSQIARWKVKRDLERQKEEAAAADPERKLKEYRAKLIRLKYLQARGDLIQKSEYLDTMGRFCKTVRNGCLSLAASLATQIRGFDTARAQTVIEDRFTELLEELSQYGGDEEPAEEREAPRA
jgi:phage terminase Nu1 subunit (DNA packaging protein)